MQTGSRDTPIAKVSPVSRKKVPKAIDLMLSTNGEEEYAGKLESKFLVFIYHFQVH